MTPLATDVSTLRLRVVQTRRAVYVIHFVVEGLFALVLLDQLFPDPRDRRLTLPLVGAFAGLGVIRYTTAEVGRRLRAGLVRSYLRAVAASQGGSISLEVRGVEPTTLGGLALAVAWTAVALATVATVTGLIDGTVVTIILVVVAVGVTYFTTDTTNALTVLARRRFSRLDATPRGLEWRRRRGDPDRISWTEIVAVRTRSGLVGRRPWIDGPAIQRAPSLARYRDTASGEEVDLLTIIEAVRPGRYVRRRHLRLGSVETVLVPVGAAWS